jgi:rhodanese-related sulfurtransferase
VKKKLLDFIFVGLGIFLIFNFIFKNRAEADPKKSYEQVLAGKAIILDVREKDEVKDGMIKAARWFPLSEYEAKKDEIVNELKQESKTKEIYIYCRSGNRSGIYKEHLANERIKAVNLGGYSNLVKEGLPTQPGPQ